MAIKIRNYQSYDEYVEHQKEKTDDPARRLRLAMAFDRRKEYFMVRFNDILERSYPENLNFQVPSKDSRVVCLGARMGPEVAAWRELGYEDSIGTDLIARKPYVIVEDFHNLSFEDETVDIFYTNSVDHSNDPAKMFSEAARCLKSGGYFIADIFFGHASTYEACLIEGMEDIFSILPDSMEPITHCNLPDSLSDPAVELIFRKSAEPREFGPITTDIPRSK